MSTDDNHPEINARPRRVTKSPSRYSDFILTDDIIDQLLSLDDGELTPPLPDGPALHIIDVDYILDDVLNTTRR